MKHPFAAILSAGLLATAAGAVPQSTQPVGSMKPNPNAKLTVPQGQVLKLLGPVIDVTVTGATKTATDQYDAPLQTSPGPSVKASISTDPKLGMQAGKTLDIARADVWTCQDGKTATPKSPAYQQKASGTDFNGQIYAIMAIHPDDLAPTGTCTGLPAVVTSTLTIKATSKGGNATRIVTVRRKKG